MVTVGKLTGAKELSVRCCVGECGWSELCSSAGCLVSDGSEDGKSTWDGRKGGGGIAIESSS